MSRLTGQQVAERLAHTLTDGQLGEIFPDQDPAAIRRLIWPAWPGKEEPQKSGGDEARPTPQGGRAMRLFSDGAARGNPGLAGAGFVVDDGQGQELLAEGIFLGRCTNNVAEYKALIYGLKGAVQLSPSRLEIFLDSQLIVRQIQGRYKVKNAGLKPLFAQVQQLLAALPEWSIGHVPRADNSRADGLANEGIDNR
ncbi:MAG: ribonuclease HI family protein [Thermodesulfobacteriota bacterium]